MIKRKFQYRHTDLIPKEFALNDKQRQFVEEYMMLYPKLSTRQISEDLVKNGLAESTFYGFDKRKLGRYKVYPKVAIFLSTLWNMGYLERLEVNEFDAIFHLK